MPVSRRAAGPSAKSMPASLSIILSTGRSDPIAVAGLAWPVDLRHHPRARTLRLRLDEARGMLRLTCPPRVSRRAALDWACRQSPWVDQQLAGLAAPEPFVPGATILVQGQAVRLVWSETLPRAVRREGAELRCGGPVSSYAVRIERYLRTEARRQLSDITAVTASRAGVTVRSVSVGDASSRWGSCSASGAIRYNWRLFLAPPHLLIWVVAHEVAHRRHMDHGPKFKALEASLYEGDVAAARAQLRALGPRLKRIGRG